MLFFSIFLACGDGESTKDTPKTVTSTITVPAEQAKGQQKNNDKCDSKLNEYSSLLDEYIELLNKANAGNAEAMQEFPKVMTKAQKVSLELQGLHKDGKIDANCWKRYNDITMRMNKMGTKPDGAPTIDQEAMKEMQNKSIDQAACIQNCQNQTDATQLASCMQGCMQ